MTNISERDQTIIDAYNSGLTMEAAGRSSSVSATTVYNVLQKHGLSSRGRRSSARIYHFNEHFFDVIDNEEKAYFLGLMYADGCNHQSSNRVLLCLKDRDLVERYAQALEANHPLEIRYEKTAADRFTLRVSSDYFCEKLASCGCKQNKTRNMEFPTETIIPSPLLHHFVRGYFDGDGSIYFNTWRKYKIVSICGTYQFLDGLSKHLPVNGHLRVKPGMYEFEIKAQPDVLCFREWLYADATIFLARKQSRFYEDNGLFGRGRQHSLLLDCSGHVT